MGGMETNNVLGYFPIRMQGHVKAALFLPLAWPVDGWLGRGS